MMSKVESGITCFRISAALKHYSNKLPSHDVVYPFCPPAAIGFIHTSRSDKMWPVTSSLRIYLVANTIGGIFQGEVAWAYGTSTHEQFCIKAPWTSTGGLLGERAGGNGKLNPPLLQTRDPETKSTLYLGFLLSHSHMPCENEHAIIFARINNAIL